LSTAGTKSNGCRGETASYWKKEYMVGPTM